MQYSKPHFILSLFTFLVMCYSINAQNTSTLFYANASAKTVMEGADFKVEFIMNNIEVKNFKPPVFDYFDVISGPSRTSSYSNVNGKVSQQYILTYILRATKAGSFQIRSAYGDYKGQKLATNPFPIKVVKRDNKSLESLGLPTDKDIFVRMEVSSDTAYLGEKVEVYYKLYTTKNVRSYDIKRESDFTGFFVHHKPSNKQANEQVVIDGTTYNSQILEKRILYPQQTGVFTFEAANITLGLPNGRQRSNSFFFGSNDKPFPVKTNDLSVNITRLPANAPESFTGAVGTFQMQSSIDKTAVSTDDAVAIKMVVAGNGDPKYLLPPTLSNLKDFEVYDPTTTENGQREYFGEVQTVKTFEYLAVPLKVGNIKLTPEFTYFDTELKAYKTLKPKTFTLNVTQGKNKTNVLLEDAGTGARSLTGRMEANSISKAPTGIFGGPIHLSLFALCLAGFGYVFYHKRKLDIEAGIDPSVKKRNKAQSIAEKRLATAKSYLDENDHRSFYDEISKSLFGFIADKLNVPNSEISKVNLEAKLNEKNISEEQVQKVMDIIKKSEMAIFAGKTEGGMEEIYSSASEVITFLADKI